MKEFTTSEFYKGVCSYVNSDNPFAFNTVSTNNYIAHYIDVFRRVKVGLDREMYNDYVKEGLQDKNHVIQ